MQHTTREPQERPELAGRLAERLLQLWERTNKPALRRLAEGAPPHEGADWSSEQVRNDWVSTCLMDTFRTSGDADAFAMLFELHGDDFRRAIRSRMRGQSGVDPEDVLQDAVLNMCRYPHRFRADEPAAFRNWAHRIVANTLKKSVQRQSRGPRPLAADFESAEPEDTGQRSPLRAAAEREVASAVDQAYVLFLGLYMVHFHRLSPRQQRALTLVEIDGLAYRGAAAELGIPFPQLKMVMFRTRRRLYRDMNETLAALARLESETLATGDVGRRPPARRRARSSRRKPVRAAG